MVSGAASVVKEEVLSYLSDTEMYSDIIPIPLRCTFCPELPLLDDCTTRAVSSHSTLVSFSSSLL